MSEEIRTHIHSSDRISLTCIVTSRHNNKVWTICTRYRPYYIPKYCHIIRIATA
uniref:MSP domain-containing protein n=1 Tax=Ascaris lumbricoides TaxID=6252 RepID=A0A0M3IRD2_ASCLU